jgi:ABC-type Mn2+/Zn2+ transport system ATPase subunit
MSEHEKEEITKQLQDVEVEEIDDKSLEDVSGGVADANGFMCNC